MTGAPVATDIPVASGRQIPSALAGGKIGSELLAESRLRVLMRLRHSLNNFMTVD